MKNNLLLTKRSFLKFISFLSAGLIFNLGSKESKFNLSNIKNNIVTVEKPAKAYKKLDKFFDLVKKIIDIKEIKKTT